MAEKTNNYKLAVCTFIGCMVLFTYLLKTSEISDKIFAGLFLSLGFLCIIIIVIPRLKEFDFKNMKATLREIKETKKEIYAKEKTVKKIAYHISEINKINAEFADHLTSTETSELQKEYLDKKIQYLLQISGSTEKNFTEIESIQNAWDKISKEPAGAQRDQFERDYNNLLRDVIDKKIMI